MKTFKPRLKARLRKNRQVLNKNIDNFFGWVKGAKLVELKECNTEEDPVRPELDNKFRTWIWSKNLWGRISRRNTCCDVFCLYKQNSKKC
jgi:hypothetical protein